MIVCKVCGTENEQGASFCGSCGTFLEWHGETVAADETQVVPVPVAPTPEPTSPPVDDTTRVLPVDSAPTEDAGPGAITCRACGQVNEAGRVYCRRCATELAPAPVPTTTTVNAAPPRARSGPPVALLGGAAVVVVLVAAGAFLLLPKGAPAPSSAVRVTDPPPSAPAPPTAPASAPVVSPSVETPTEPPTAAPPTKASLTGRIVFTAIEDGNANLWTWDPATDKVRRLVGGAGNQSEPAWAPDGSAVVYSAPDGLRIALANGDPFDPPRLTRAAEDRNPAWSPDGARVVFASDRGALNARNIMARAVGDPDGDVVVLVNSNGEDWDPQFSPDGDTIVFASERQGPGRLFLMDADGGNERVLDLGAGSFDDPMFSPVGDWLAFTRRDDPDAQKDLWVARIDGSELRQLTDTEANENDLAWSPDGRVIAVTRADDEGRIVLLDVVTAEEIGDIGADGASRNSHPDWWWPDR